MPYHEQMVLQLLDRLEKILVQLIHHSMFTSHLVLRGCNLRIPCGKLVTSTCSLHKNAIVAVGEAIALSMCIIYKRVWYS